MISPAAARCTPKMVIKVVVLPAPLAPMRQEIPPARTAGNALEGMDVAVIGVDVLEFQYGFSVSVMAAPSG
jgi:hypothetical protein